MGHNTQDDHLFLKSSVIVIGWKDFGDLSQVGTRRKAYKARYEKVYPEAPKGSIPTGAGMTFIMNFGLGDIWLMSVLWI